MKSINLPVPRIYTAIRAVFSFLMLGLLSSYALQAQDANLAACNSFSATTWVANTFSLTASGANWTNQSNVTNSNTGDFASTSTNGAVLRIADDVDYTSAGYYVGVRVGRPALEGGGNVTVRTLLGTTIQDTYTTNVGGTVTGSQENIGFYATKPFNAIEVVNGSTNTTRVYYVFLQRFCAYDLNLACNTYTPLSRPNFASTIGSATSSVLINNETRAIDDDPTNFASFNLSLGALTFAVENPVFTYPASTSAPLYVGYDIRAANAISVDLLGGITVRTYLDGDQVQEATGGNLLLGVSLLGGSSGRQNVGFAATAPFDEVRIIFDGISLGQTEIYSAVIKKFCAGPDFACNTNTYLNESTHPLLVDPANTGFGGLACVNCTIANTSSGIDGNASTGATINILAGAGNSGAYAVKNPLSTFPASTTAPYFVGFDILNPALVGANLLSNITVQTLNAAGTVVQSVSATNGLVSVSSSALSGGGRQTLGFLTTQPFSTIKIIFANTASLSLGSTTIYNAVVKRFCPAAPIACKTQVELTNPVYPVYVNSKNTGVGGLGCVGCTINNVENVVSATATTPTTIVTVGSVASSARLSVANALEEYPAGTFAGFDIGSSTLANINLLSSTQITLYNNGSVVQPAASGSSLLAGATLLSGSRQIVGIVAQVPFDEIQIEFNQTGVSLGTISIYRAVVQPSCETPIACNQTIYLNTGPTSAVIEGSRTGITGGVDVGALGGSTSIRDPWAVVSPSTTDFARIGNVLAVNALSQASISVADPATEYPAGTYAGFTIRKGDFLVSADLLPYLTVRTYLNGNFRESRSAANLLDLSVLTNLFGTPDGVYNIGFISTQSFDEIQLSVGTLVNANVTNKYVDVFGAFADTRTSSNGGSLVCNFTVNPDFNVTYKNVPVSGNVSTNDKVPSGTTYGTPVANGGNPGGATVSLNPNGTYSFVATASGVYNYTVPACGTGQTNCPATTLTVTVLDPTIVTNKPVANPDYASVLSSTATPGSVSINVRANDGPGENTGTLGTPTISVNPTHGTATVDGSGNVVYTPAAGFVGDDILTYQVCVSPTVCATALVTVHVLIPGSNITTIVDDYAKTRANTAVSGNLLTNDFGSGLTVSNPTTTATAAGTLVTSANGNYTFTPANGVTGPVDFTYTACDNSTTAVCGSATLHLLVAPAPDLSPVVYARPTPVYNTKDITIVVEVYELNGISTNGPITVKLSKDPKVALSFSSSSSTIGGLNVQNGAWTFDGTSDNDYYTLTTNQSIEAGGVLAFGLTGTVTPGSTSGSITFTTVIDPNSGGQIVVTNNTDADKVEYFQQ